jgi:hypothetical protein
VSEAAAIRLSAAAQPRVRARQNWVLDPLQDSLFIIAAPLLSLALALLAIQRLGVERGAELVITAHIVLTVAHHLPTFIRIYGDVDLFRRFKWSFVLGPVVPLAFAITMLAYLNINDYPVEYILYLYVFLALWDPWHFLRQHFGFMRIYDRNNGAPQALAARMDWWLCTTWFVYIMVASAQWIPDILDDLYHTASLPVALLLPPTSLTVAAQLAGAAALAMTVAYAGYLAWCWRRGFVISIAKLALLGCTFGVMYLTYTPNEMILRLAPAWGFKVGFATLGIVHMTQYLAIVWRYDRRLAQQQRARTGWFGWLHARPTRWSAALAAAGYVLFCLAYGDAITQRPQSRWLLSVVLAIGFTSTLMHYYYDGFIWKVRHQQNRAALGLAPVGEHAGGDASSAGTSWWSAAEAMTPSRMLARQLLYFGVPLAILTVGAFAVWSGDRDSYIDHMRAAEQRSQSGDPAMAAAEARLAELCMLAELPMVRRMAELQPTAAREAELAFLLYNKAFYEEQVLPALAGERPDEARRRRMRIATLAAATVLERALGRGGSVAHAGRGSLTRDEALSVLQSWQRRLG